ncbi:MAG: hypothetical protein JO190_11785 [Candidatus Eremiobacteraeota bacterium]|nr:hypothetical protein [Candidatus Eremiobacteraeota bacterium]MBV8498223.1 hypothetical protein [Candidatus Eremiobacteraeota bacterium]
MNSAEITLKRSRTFAPGSGSWSRSRTTVDGGGYGGGTGGCGGLGGGGGSGCAMLIETTRVFAS